MFACCCAPNDDKDTDYLHALSMSERGPEVAPSAATQEMSESPPQKEIEAKEPQTWMINLKKPKAGPLGLELEIDRNKKLSVLILPRHGPALTWNQSSKDKGMRPGDIVEAVNETRGDASSLLQEITNSDRFALHMKRFVDYTVTIKLRERLGLQAADVKGLAIVENIDEGGDVFLYNKTCLAGYRIALGDWLISVNGTSGSPRDLILMLGELSEGETILRFGRPSPL